MLADNGFFAYWRNVFETDLKRVVVVVVKGLVPSIAKFPLTSPTRYSREGETGSDQGGGWG